jgi:hypothetical protein
MMNDDDDLILRQAIQRDLQVLQQEAPPMHFARLWQQVRAQRERTLQRRLAMTSVLAASSLLIVGLGSLLTGYAWQAAIPCCAVAFWLAPQTFEALLEGEFSKRARPKLSTPSGRR